MLCNSREHIDQDGYPTSLLHDRTSTLSEALQPPQMAESSAKTPRKKSRKETDEQLLNVPWPRKPPPQVEDKAPVIKPMTSHPREAITLNSERLHQGKAEDQISNNVFEEPTAT
jgi:hypothetical protein